MLSIVHVPYRSHKQDKSTYLILIHGGSSCREVETLNHEILKRKERIPAIYSLSGPYLQSLQDLGPEKYSFVKKK